MHHGEFGEPLPKANSMQFYYPHPMGSEIMAWI